MRLVFSILLSLGIAVFFAITAQASDFVGKSVDPTPLTPICSPTALKPYTEIKGHI